jgi:ATP-dependent Lon protease
MPEKVLREAEKQLKRLEKMHPDSAEAATIRTYLDWLVELPWSKNTKDNLDIKAAKKVLNDDHYDLEKVKERILEYLSVRKIKEKMKGPILCFIGPPGVGKTSLGRSIARALGREFVRMSLGGVMDEAEIRGHRRTYVGALPGRIIQGIKQAGTNNPVFMAEDKPNRTDFRGPSSALLGGLKRKFACRSLSGYRRSDGVMFITTATCRYNSGPLRTGWKPHIFPDTEEENSALQRTSLPKQLEEHGLTAKIKSLDAS